MQPYELHDGRWWWLWDGEWWVWEEVGVVVFFSFLFLFFFLFVFLVGVGGTGTRRLLHWNCLVAVGGAMSVEVPQRRVWNVFLEGWETGLEGREGGLMIRSLQAIFDLPVYKHRWTKDPPPDPRHWEQQWLRWEWTQKNVALASKVRYARVISLFPHGTVVQVPSELRSLILEF